MKRNNVEVIENTEEEQNKYSNDVNSCGEGYLELTKEDIDSLLEGKCIAIFDGEYTTFITLNGENDE